MPLENLKPRNLKLPPCTAESYFLLSRFLMLERLTTRRRRITSIDNLANIYILPTHGRDLFEEVREEGRPVEAAAHFWRPTYSRKRSGTIPVGPGSIVSTSTSFASIGLPPMALLHVWPQTAFDMSGLTWLYFILASG